MNEKLKTAFSGDLSEYKSIPFWSWNNYLDEEELVRQIYEMKSAGMGGFIMHARTGLKEEYLGEKWFLCIDICLKKARELGMKAWVYDDNGWPSGFAGGKLLTNETYRARYLEYSVGEFDNNAFVNYISDSSAGFKRVVNPINGIKEYHRVYLKISPANTDILNPEVVKAFIEETHEKYYERFKDSFGRELAGFFTDEPQYYRAGTPYSPMLKYEFHKIGEDVRDGLIWLFLHDERGYEFRQKYFGIINSLYTDVYYKTIYEWCKAHNCKLTGHSVEEDSLYTQMWGGASVMSSYEFEDIPAIDSLCRKCMYELSPKQIGSVAAQLGKKQVLTETFACCGYDVTPKQLKSIAESQYFHGVNMMCQHLFPYSIAAQGKHDHPPVFSRHGNWLQEFKIFNDYFTRLGYIIANTEEKTEIAILHPIREIWLEYVRKEDYESVKIIEEDFRELLLYLRKRGISYHFIDENILRKHGRVENNILKVGKKEYKSVIIPKMTTISRETYNLLKRYTGKLCVLGELKYINGSQAEIALNSNTSLEQIISEFKSPFSSSDGKSFIINRKGEIGDFIFVKNNSMSEQSFVELNNIAENYKSIDILTLEEKNISNKIVLNPNDSMILIKNSEAVPTENVSQVCDITEKFKICNISENYFILDTAFIRKENEVFGKKDR